MPGPPSPLRYLPMLVLGVLLVFTALLGRPASGDAGLSPAPPATPAPGWTPPGAAGLPAPPGAVAGLRRPRPSPALTAARLARSLDRFMRRAVPASPLVGLGRVFVREGRAAGLDPRLLVAIALQESRLGTTGSAPSARNAFGWGPAIAFRSWPAGIRAVARGLRRGYLARGRTTITTIAQVYAPPGAPNDDGFNATWAEKVGLRYAELGGNPWSSVARPVEA